jgi:hypothetical protein
LQQCAKLWPVETVVTAGPSLTNEDARPVRRGTRVVAWRCLADRFKTKWVPLESGQFFVKAVRRFWRLQSTYEVA